MNLQSTIKFIFDYQLNIALSFKILILHEDHSLPLIQSSLEDSKPASIAAPFHVTIWGSKSFGELIISICPKKYYISIKKLNIQECI